MGVRQVALAGWRGTGRAERRAGRSLLAVPGLLVVVPVAVLVAARRFDGLYGQDAYAYFDYAVGPLREALLRAQVVPPAFFWPPGYPALVALVSLLLGPTTLAAALVSLMLGAAVPIATALLAGELWPGRRRLMLLAGGLTAVSGQLWQSSAVIMSDTTGLALATVGVWASVAYGRRGTARWLLLAAAALGWATITRWIYGLVALVCVVYVLPWLLRGGPRRLVAHALPAFLLGLGLLAWVGGPVLATPAGQTPPFIGTLETYGADTWSAANLLHREFHTSGHGFVRYSLPNGIYYAAAPLHPYMLTPLLGLLALPGIVVLVNHRSWRALSLLVGWAAAMYLFHAGSTWQNLRYVLAYLPPLAVLAAVGADALLGRRGWTARLTAGWLVAGAVWAMAGGVLLTNQFITRKHADLALVGWVEEHTPADAQLLTFGPTLTFRHYGQRPTLELYELSPADLPAVLERGRPSYLLLDVGNVEEQWAGRAPALDYAWLRDSAGLTQVGQDDGLTLFRVGSG